MEKKYQMFSQMIQSFLLIIALGAATIILTAGGGTGEYSADRQFADCPDSLSQKNGQKSRHSIGFWIRLRPALSLSDSTELKPKSNPGFGPAGHSVQLMVPSLPKGLPSRAKSKDRLAKAEGLITAYL